MKIRHNTYRHKSTTIGPLLALITFLAACGSGSDSGGGIIGTGMIDGTVPTNRAFASNSVTFKATSGERDTTTIDDNGRFKSESLQGSGPYLMRVDLGNGNAYYSVAHPNGNAVVQNIHGYSDVAIRNWFATRGLDIDDVFSNSGAIAQLPTKSEIDSINSEIRKQIEPALIAYSLGSTDLQTVVFNADDTGVDNFLDQNPILISNVNGDVFITIIVYDPVTGTQSIVSQGLPINTDFTANDIVPPSAPTGLRVLPSASDEIVLAWNEASDNIGVITYEVTRNGVLVDTTPYPVYLDSPLEANVTYTYTITALDAAGNSSIASQSGSSTTLDAADTIAPPAPTGLQLTPSITSIDVRWVQSDIGDVKDFTVLRATGNAMLDRRAQVTSTQLIDAGLNSATNYCYQIVANDASANASDPSEQVCAVTGGNLIDGGGTTPQGPNPGPEPGPEPGPNPNPDTLQNNEHLQFLDVSSLPCTNELDVNALTGEARITEGCYLVNRNISLDATNLIIDAGVVLKFNSRTGIRISDDSSLSANGTREQPIVLTGQQTTAGYWNGLEYVFSNNTKNSLTHVLVEYAGTTGDNAAAVASNSTTGLIVRLKMANVLIRQSANYGFRFNDGTLVDQFDNISSTQNQRPGKATPTVAGLFGSGLSLTGNNTDTVDLTSDSIDRAMTLADHGVAYSIDNLRVNAPVEVAEGVTLVFDAAGQLRVGQDGSLRVAGTAANPVLFTGAQATPGYWRGVELVFSNSTNNDLQHLTIEYGGSGNGVTGNLLTNSTAGLPVRLKLESVTLRNSATNGFSFRQGTTLEQFNNVISTQNEESGTAYPTQIASFGSSVDLSGNTFDRVTLDNGTIDSVQTWPLLNVPVRFNRLSVENSLTLSAGQVMIAASGAEIYVNDAGSLSAIGTASAPIVFRGEQQTPGYWDGLYYVFSNSTLNVLDHVRISDGGSGAPADNGNIDMNCPTAGLPGRLSVSNAFISNSNGWGILADGGGCTLSLGANVTFSNNLQGDILQ